MIEFNTSILNGEEINKTLLSVSSSSAGERESKINSRRASVKERENKNEMFLRLWMDTRTVKAHLAFTETAAHLAILPVERVHEQSYTLQRDEGGGKTLSDIHLESRSVQLKNKVLKQNNATW